ncbi:MAG TPA: ABC transporter ATP-binding protein [Solirubrobacterales bacterium]|jgi:ABC-2 type transport system ATP-binding protein|nr:ABC transporter ATP-binding protein [Solirubrobacterales bacterium]HMU26511.1 ABC transporter ATP-binding protein [Solirubrobacterales bacterium]HMW44887.1 ABC transporter ATP-binding protein [Solirubrobacterales bacterium]HMX72156.1 ABC transporter ATP-binding protein [Solirubrobacterales bacterium]HMY24818.1 ABC transporter ATP-binding protein [Solirubrobacterales bacterium]
MPETLIRLEGVTKKFGATVALDDLSLAVPEGSVCGLLGPNGSGKTTAIRILLGLAGMNSGTASLLGARPGGPGFTEAVRQTGSLIEGPALYGRATARQNMQIQAATLGLADAGAEIDDLLELVDLGDRADSNARTFSLGMKQRLGLAISLLGKPRLVLLDEPTNGLDPSGIVEIRELIKQLPERGVTVLVSSHLLSEVQLMCDRVTIINKGRLVADGTMEEILASTGVGEGYRVYVRISQAEAATAILRRAGLEVEDRGEGSLVARGEIEDDSEITRILAESGIWLRGLMRERPDLERVFLSLTDGAGDES